jgi:hypothetical protein
MQCCLDFRPRTRPYSPVLLADHPHAMPDNLSTPRRGSGAGPTRGLGHFGNPVTLTGRSRMGWTRPGHSTFSNSSEWHTTLLTSKQQGSDCGCNIVDVKGRPQCSETSIMARHQIVQCKGCGQSISTGTAGLSLPIPSGLVHCPYCRQEHFYLEQDRVEFDTENGLRDIFAFCYGSESGSNDRLFIAHEGTWSRF